ncbi:MAG: TonB-dependent receptor [Gemmatimonadetes bacterium]|nr:TonB-dependent receptor [Gemmatimonadota bacterium]
MSTYTSRLLCLAALFGVSSSASAQASGAIAGVVTNAETHTAVMGAKVALSGRDRSALTDDHGRYTLRDVPAGAQRVLVTAIGRKSDSSTVTVRSGATATFDVALQQGSLLLSGMVVSATRTQVDAGKVASTVNVLTPEQVRQSPARESQDMLREIPSVELPRTSSLVGGSAQIVSIRGVDEGRTAVLFDGIPVNDAWGEWIDWGRVPKSMVERVEVVEGGTSSLYGNGAMGGVISFFSHPMAPGDATAQIDGGSRESRHGSFAMGIPVVGALSATVIGDYQEKGGYILTDAAVRGPVDVESNVIQRNGYLRLNYAPGGQWSGFLTGHLFGDSRNLGTPLTFANRDQRNVDLGFNYNNLASGALSVRAWDGRQIESQRSSAIRSAALRNVEDSSLTAQIPSHDWGASAQWTRSSWMGLESFSLGGDLRHYQGDFNEVDFNTTCPGANCGTIARTVSSGGDQTLSGAFAQAITNPLTPLRVELSARVDQWSNDNGHSFDVGAGNTIYPDRSKTSFSPRLGMRYEVASTFSLRGAVYRAFRAPNLAELYRKQISATSITVPNPDLSAESALGREVGFDWQPMPWIQTKGTYYVADYSDFNVPVTLTGADKPAVCGTITTCRQRLNVTKVRSTGAEGYVAIRPIEPLLLSAGVSYDDARQESGVPANTSHENKPHVNRVPSPRQTIRATYTSSLAGEWTVVWRHEGQTTTLGGLPLEAFTVVDAHAEHALTRGLSLFGAMDNIGDVKYQINIAGSGTAASPTIISRGWPRTVRIGVIAKQI